MPKNDIEWANAKLLAPVDHGNSPSISPIPVVEQSIVYTNVFQTLDNCERRARKNRFHDSSW